MLLFLGDDLEKQAGFYLVLSQNLHYPGCSAMPRISIIGRYGINDQFPFFIHGCHLVAQLAFVDSQTELFKNLYKEEIDAFFSGKSAVNHFYLPFPDLSLEGPEFAYLYLEELLKSSQNASSEDGKDALSQIKRIEEAEEKPITEIMKELKEEIVACFQPELLYAPVPEHSKEPEKAKQVEEIEIVENKLVSSLKATETLPTAPAPEQSKEPKKANKKNERKKNARAVEEAEKKAAHAKRLEEKFESYMGSKRVKLRKATKLFNAVFKSKPDLLKEKENVRGSHVSLTTTEGSATLVRPHGKKGDFSKRPLFNFITKISNAFPQFMQSKK